MRKTALITGATSGIGLALAKEFASHHYDLILISRDLEDLNTIGKELEKAQKITVTPLAQDLSSPKAAEQIAKTLERKGLHVDILINNAGLGVYDDFVKTDPVKIELMLHLNLQTTTLLTRLLLPQMIERRHGKILNIASTGAFQPGPHMAVYYATKAYILSFSEALRSELKNKGISVTALCPGPTKTRSSVTQAKMYRIFPKLSPEAVATFGYDAVMKGKSTAIPGPVNKFLAWGNRLVPRDVSTTLSRWTLE
jgi:short-subunit dehydrogenase